MRYLLFVVLLLCNILSIAQIPDINPTKLLGTWVKTNVTYLNGEELSDKEIVKYTYSKYTFKENSALFTSGYYESEGTETVANLIGNMLYIRTKADYPVNKFKIQELTPNRLIMYESNESYNENPNALKYTFVPESQFMDSIPLRKKDIHLIDNKDTIYNTSEKLYPKFAETDLNTFFSYELANKKKPKEGYHLVSFIINKQGKIDSIKTLKSLGPKFEEIFKKAFKKTEHMWSPAYLNGKPVSVIRHCKLSYFGDIGDFFLLQQANTAYINNDYKLALNLLDKALEKVDTNTESLYKRGICKYVLDDKAGACADWAKAEEFGSTAVIPLIEKYCKP